MKRSKRVGRVKVSGDGVGVVSHAGVGMLRELADYTGLTDGVSEALADTYRGVPIHAPGRVFADMAVAVADGADTISGIEVLGDREDLFGSVASMPTCWRMLGRVDADHLPRVQAARAAARTAAWDAGAGPDLGSSCVWTSMPRSPSPTRRKRTRPRPGNTRLGSTRCVVRR